MKKDETLGGRSSRYDDDEFEDDDDEKIDQDGEPEPSRVKDTLPLEQVVGSKQGLTEFTEQAPESKESQQKMRPEQSNDDENEYSLPNDEDDDTVWMIRPAIMTTRVS